MTFVCGALGAATILVEAAPPGTFTRRIAVDQFGYQPEMTKVAVISDPIQGFNAAESYVPATSLEVRTWGSNTVVYGGATIPWSNSATHVQSGDRAWWFDFSALKRWGEYYIYDPANDKRSARFVINHRVYENVLKQATRVYYYQRRGTDKRIPYADPRWTDGTNFMRPLQDTQCQSVTNKVPATQKDLRGGWFDAGDYNKYTTFTDSTLSDLLFAYLQNPLIWPDDWNIPESGNGLPDLLDEVKWELDWLLRMQNTNGSVLSKMGVTAFQSASPPSAETSQIFYGHESTTATLSAAGSFGLAARAYLNTGQTNYANVLSNAAVAAYNWAVANPAVMYTNAGFQSANPEVGQSTYAYDRDRFRMRAAIFLYDLTRQGAYRTYVEGNYLNIHAISWTWWGPYETSVQDALLFYSTLPGVTASVANVISSRCQSSINGGDFLPAWTGGWDAYRAHLGDDAYHWGNNTVKGHQGILFFNNATYNLNVPQVATYRAAAASYVHYLHGVNPLTMAFLSNMYEHGADFCANEMYHSWFGNGTIYDNALTSPNGPAPGYITGGANKNFQPDAAYTGPRLSPPMDQPPQKAYKDWNTSWPENSWEITEPAIYSQAAYVFLLSRFVRPMTYQDWATGHGLSGSIAEPLADADGDGCRNFAEFGLGLSPSLADAPAPPQFSLQPHTVSGQTNTYLTVHFLRQMGSTNLTYAVQGSADLLNWTPLCVAAGTNHPTGSGFVSQTGTAYERLVLARDTVPVETATTPRFVRLRLTWN